MARRPLNERELRAIRKAKTKATNKFGIDGREKRGGNAPKPVSLAPVKGAKDEGESK